MKKTTRTRKSHRSNVLEVRVMSPRIAWLNFLKLTGKAVKYSLILGGVGAICWGGWIGVRKAFHENPDFRLRNIDVNANSAVDGIDVVRIGGIDPEANLFDLDTALIAERLSKVPALSEVKVERHLPGTLSIRVAARTPAAWIACPQEGHPAQRKAGSLVVDRSRHTFPCTPNQFETAKNLPLIVLSPDPADSLKSGTTATHPELARCFRLLDAISAVDPAAIASIESVRQANSWSLELVTRAGVTATFGLGDHERQIANFRASLDHAARQGYTIDTINLIPKENVPVTIRGEAAAPKALVVPEPTPEDRRRDRRSRDLENLLNNR